MLIYGHMDHIHHALLESVDMIKSLSMELIATTSSAKTQGTEGTNMHSESEIL